MALKSVIPFPIFAPSNPISTTTTTTPSTTEVRFSRWNNANAEKFVRQQRSQQQIEGDLRRYRRFESALNIANISNPPPTTATTLTENRNSYFKSTGTPSTPSLPSIPGRKSKYSKNPSNFSRNSHPHPAFRKLVRKTKLPVQEEDDQVSVKPELKVSEVGVSYVVPDAPFEFMYSYTETPKVKPLALREPPVAPFGPDTMPRPWTGRKPLPPSKKKLPEFDSFVPPPANKKGIKSVQKAGPFLPGSGPKYVRSREEILGDPLTAEEVKDLIEGCRKTQRQLNIGRDGLTHNMLDNIHSHWKRRRVCKIKCKGVCTVDMDNVCQHLEDKTGGKIIYRKGGVVYLFRGRNYNYKTRPRYPLMLWRPVTPVYPRLIKHTPEGLTLEEATEMRKRGRNLIPICKLGKNGVYINLVKNVREAFEACELVRIDCQGMNGSDYRKIGAKLKDLVPCVLISFEREHVLMWRGNDWKSSLTRSGNEKGAGETPIDITALADKHAMDSLTSQGEDVSSSASLSEISFQENSNLQDASVALVLDSDTNISTAESELSTYLPDPSVEGASVVIPLTTVDSSTPDEDSMSLTLESVVPLERSTHGNEILLEADSSAHSDDANADACSLTTEQITAPLSHTQHQMKLFQADQVASSEIQDVTESSKGSNFRKLSSPCTEDVLRLLTQAVASGSAVILDDEACLDADAVYEKSVALAQIAPPGPVFTHTRRKVPVQGNDCKESGDIEQEKIVPVPEKKPKIKKSSRTAKAQVFEGQFLGAAPPGSLGVDELAKLLA